MHSWVNSENKQIKGSFIMEEKQRESDITSRRVHRESNLTFTLNSDKDQRKKFASVFAFDQCK